MSGDVTRPCPRPDCEGTMYATYWTESEWREPYVCSTCLHDQKGILWDDITKEEIEDEGQLMVINLGLYKHGENYLM